MRKGRIRRPKACGLSPERHCRPADWLLGQQGPDEAGATVAFLERSDGAREWASALTPLAGDRLPEISDGRGGPAPAPTAVVPVAQKTPRKTLSGRGLFTTAILRRSLVTARTLGRCVPYSGAGSREGT